MSEGISTGAQIGLSSASMGIAAAALVTNLAQIPGQISAIQKEMADVALAERELLKRRIAERMFEVQREVGAISVRSGGMLTGRPLEIAAAGEIGAAQRETEADVLLAEQRIRNAQARADRMRQEVINQATQGLFSFAGSTLNQGANIARAQAIRNANRLVENELARQQPIGGGNG